MFDYDFMRYAFIAGIFIALISCVMGVFVVARQTSFFTHTLSEIGFSGAAFGVFAGISPLTGMLIFTMTSAIFGSIVGIDINNLYTLIGLSVILLVVVSALFRRLAYNSFDSQGAEYNQRYNQIVSIVFLLLLALTISITAQIVGALLIFVLLTIPASAAKYFAHTLWKMIGLTFIFVLVGIWLGLYLSFVTDWPVSFFITVIEALFYGAAIVKERMSASRL